MGSFENKKNIYGTRWLVSLVDGDTLATWIFLLKENLKVYQHFKDFRTMIQTQYQAKICVLNTDNAKECFTSSLGDFFFLFSIFLLHIPTSTMFSLFYIVHLK